MIGEGGERYYIVQVACNLTLILPNNNNIIYSKANCIAMSSLLQPSNLQIMRKH